MAEPELAPEPIIVPAAPAAFPFDGVRLRIDAWPIAESDGPDGLVDGVAVGGDFVIGAGVRRPWAVIARALDGPVDVAAVAVRGAPDARSPRDITLLSYLGAVPLTSATYPRFVELSTRLGVGVVPEHGEPVVFVLQQPASAHYVWLRVHSTWGGAGGALDEIAVLTPEQLDAARLADGIAFVQLQPEGDAAYDGLDLSGIGDVWDESPSLETDEDGPPADGGSEARDESAPVDAPTDTDDDP